MAEEQPESGTRLTATEIHDNIREPAEKEIERPAAALLWSALASGLAIGFSFPAAAFASSLVSGSYRTAAAAAAYPLIGKAIGGVLLVALLNYGQVAAERDGSEEGKDGAARR